LISPEIVAEIHDVLTRPKTLKRFPALTIEAVDVFLRDVESRAVTFFEVPRVFTLDRDPKDEPYINLASASGAGYPATWDKDLLDLMGDEDFRRQFPALTILEPPALLRMLEHA
jgi:putative PIN family toxin of toxin-antitoxin system